MKRRSFLKILGFTPVLEVPKLLAKEIKPIKAVPEMTTTEILEGKGSRNISLAYIEAFEKEVRILAQESVNTSLPRPLVRRV